MTSILLDFSNLRVGGALQVASAVLHDLTEASVRAQHPWLDTHDVRIILSSAVARHFQEPLDRLPGQAVVVDSPRTLVPLIVKPRIRYDLRFTLFGPPYSGRVAHREISGFAEGTLLYRPREYNPKGRRSWRDLMRAPLRRLLVRGWDVYLTESPAVRQRLNAQFGIPLDRIEVVPNRPHPLITRAPLVPAATGADDTLHLIYPARAYAHKNIDLIVPVSTLFAAQTRRRLILHTTLKDSEWRALSPDARACIVNHGELSPSELLALYATVDASFFPSLLESNSATPLEANVLGLPLIASDRDFVHANAHATCVFDPLDPCSAAEALIAFDTHRDSYRAAAVEVAYRYRAELQTTSRTGRYLEIIERELPS